MLMKTFVPLLIPDEALVLIVALGGLALMVGARRFAGMLFALVLGSIFLPVLIQPLIQSVPVWILWVIAAYIVYLIPFAAVSVFSALTRPALGRRVSDEAAGHLAADVARAMIRAHAWLLFAPFRLVVTIVRSFR